MFDGYRFGLYPLREQQQILLHWPVHIGRTRERGASMVHLAHKPSIRPTQRSTIWAAEDGRCEICGRPMDRRVARVVLRDPSTQTVEAQDLNAWALVCVFCYGDWTHPFETMRIGRDVAELVAHGLGTDLPTAAQWLRTMLSQYGVIVDVQSKGVQIWLPGIGRGWVRARATAAPILRQWHPDPHTSWTVRRQPQARTRGLPRPQPAMSLKTWEGFIPSHQEVKRVANVPINAISVTVVIPTEHWPKLRKAATMEYEVLEVPLQTPDGLTLTARLTTKSLIKADRKRRQLESQGQQVTIALQGQLAPDLSLTRAGFQVHGRPQTTE